MSELYELWTEPSTYAGKTVSQTLQALLTAKNRFKLDSQTVIMKSLHLLPSKLVQKFKEYGLHIQCLNLSLFIEKALDLTSATNTLDSVFIHSTKKMPTNLQNPLNFPTTDAFNSLSSWPPKNDSGGPVPMVFSSSPYPATSYSGPIHGIPLKTNPALKEHLDKHGLCYYCRADNSHTADSCPKKANKPTGSLYPTAFRSNIAAYLTASFSRI